MIADIETGGGYRMSELNSYSDEKLTFEIETLKGKIGSANETVFMRMLHELQVYTPSILKSGHHDEKFYQEMKASFKENDGWQGEILNRRKNGEVYQEWANIKVIRNGDGEVDCYIRHLFRCFQSGGDEA